MPQVTDLDIAKVVDRIGEDGHLFRNMLRWFADGQGSFARDIRAAIAAGDHATAQRLAHTLKGAAGDIGATRLGEASKRLEAALQAPSAKAPSALLDAVEALLAQQLSHIRQATAPLAGAPAMQSSLLDDTGLASLLRQMATLLRNDDAQALELLAPLMAHSKRSGQPQEFHRLQGLVERFSLNEALMVLHGIAASMNITLD